MPCACGLHPLSCSISTCFMFHAAVLPIWPATQQLPSICNCLSCVKHPQHSRIDSQLYIDISRWESGFILKHQINRRSYIYIYIGGYSHSFQQSWIWPRWLRATDLTPLQSRDGNRFINLQPPNGEHTNNIKRQPLRNHTLRPRRRRHILGHPNLHYHRRLRTNENAHFHPFPPFFKERMTLRFTHPVCLVSPSWVWVQQSIANSVEQNDRGRSPQHREMRTPEGTLKPTTMSCWMAQKYSCLLRLRCDLALDFTATAILLRHPPLILQSRRPTSAGEVLSELRIRINSSIPLTHYRPQQSRCQRLRDRIRGILGRLTLLRHRVSAPMPHPLSHRRPQPTTRDRLSQALTSLKITFLLLLLPWPLLHILRWSRPWTRPGNTTTTFLRRARLHTRRTTTATSAEPATRLSRGRPASGFIPTATPVRSHSVARMQAVGRLSVLEVTWSVTKGAVTQDGKSRLPWYKES